VGHIYGLEEAGGTSLLYLSSEPFEALGFKTHVSSDPYPRLTWGVLSKIFNVVSVAGVAQFGIGWITNRKDLMDRVGRGELTLQEAMKEMPPLKSKSEDGHDA
jgi:hypothetical protein